MGAGAAFHMQPDIPRFGQLAHGLVAAGIAPAQQDIAIRTCKYLHVARQGILQIVHRGAGCRSGSGSAIHFDFSRGGSRQHGQFIANCLFSFSKHGKTALPAPCQVKKPFHIFGRPETGIQGNAAFLPLIFQNNFRAPEIPRKLPEVVAQRQGVIFSGSHLQQAFFLIPQLVQQFLQLFDALLAGTRQNPGLARLNLRLNHILAGPFQKLQYFRAGNFLQAASLLRG